ncbi:uncharacterized protein LOC111262288 [Varroa jacobsoni]|uniref:uncharacterized protein LOC111262288 n=1 Tax=Varroa jacobsoni TaxID=62625 RepID=UPI000BF5B17A|nr:uncharacterized protein LOC111262288 [Varroa jacobsoni]
MRERTSLSIELIAAKQHEDSFVVVPKSRILNAVLEQIIKEDICRDPELASLNIDVSVISGRGLQRRMVPVVVMGIVFCILLALVVTNVIIILIHRTRKGRNLTRSTHRDAH